MSTKRPTPHSFWFAGTGLYQRDYVVCSHAAEISKRARRFFYSYMTTFLMSSLLKCGGQLYEQSAAVLCGPTGVAINLYANFLNSTVC